MSETSFFLCCAASIPVYCTGPALILTGALMMINVTKIDWNDLNKAIPAFLTISLMPLTYSISYGAKHLLTKSAKLHTDLQPAICSTSYPDTSCL